VLFFDTAFWYIDVCIEYVGGSGRCDELGGSKMSWSSKKFFGFLTGAAVAGSVLVGCAGDVTIPIDSGTPVIPVSGGVLQDRATANESRAAQPNPQQVQVTR
jgi:hypothetical protein